MWQVKMETAELQQFDAFSAVGFKDSVYLFGGESLNGGSSNAVFRMHGDFQWDRWGSMSPKRDQFTALANDVQFKKSVKNEFLVNLPQKVLI